MTKRTVKDEFQNIAHTKKDCMKSAKRYLSPTEWAKQDHKRYWAAHRNGWLDECKAHMVPKLNTESVVKGAQKYEFVTDWRKNEPSASAAARPDRLNCVFECTQHMKDKSTGLTLLQCFDVARLYHNNIEWMAYGNESYRAAVRSGWFEFCSSHMKIEVNLEKHEFTFEECVKISKYFDRATHWGKAHLSRKFAERMGWVVSKPRERPQLEIAAPKTRRMARFENVNPLDFEPD